MFFALMLSLSFADRPADAQSCATPPSLIAADAVSTESWCGGQTDPEMAPQWDDDGEYWFDEDCIQVLADCPNGWMDNTIHYPDGSVDRICQCSGNSPSGPGGYGVCMTRPEAEDQATPNTQACDINQIEVLTCEPMPSASDPTVTCWQCWYECQKVDDLPDTPETEPDGGF